MVIATMLIGCIVLRLLGAIRALLLFRTCDIKSTWRWLSLIVFLPVLPPTIQLVRYLFEPGFSTPHILDLCIGLIISLVLLASIFFIEPIFRQIYEFRTDLQKKTTEIDLAQSIANLGVWEWDIPKNTVRWSDHTFRLFGHQPDDLEPNFDLFMDHVHPEDRELVRQKIHATLEHGEPYSFKFRIRRADGSERTLATSAQLFRNPDGQPLLLKGISHDITEVYQAQEKNRRSDLTLETIGRLAKIGGWEIDLTTNPRKLTWTEEIFKIHELPHDKQPTVEEAIAFYTPETQQLIRENVGNGIASGQSWYAECPITTTTGKRVWLRSVGEAEYKDGKVTRVYGSAQDITEIKETEQALQTSLKRTLEYETLFILSNALTCIGGFDGYFKRINPRFTETLGYSEEELFQRPWLDFVHPADHKSTIAEAEALIAGGYETHHFVNRYICKDGSILWFSWHAKADPENQRFYCVAVDTTDLVKTEEENRVLQEQIIQAEKLEILGVLAGGVAHDFNNVLSTMLGHCCLIQDDLHNPESISFSLSEMEAAIDRAKEMTDQLFAIAGKGEPTLKKVDLQKLVEETCKLVKGVLSKNAKLTFEFSADLPQFSADAMQIRQVIMNLLTNASDALEDAPGEILVKTGSVDLQNPADFSPFAPKGTLPGQFVFLEVSDTGCGMSAEIVQKVFLPFFSTKRNGRGIGLASSCRIAKRHGGFLRVESTPGQGTCFKAYFPLVFRDHLPIPKKSGARTGGLPTVVAGES